jgi:hypothetical protein
LRGNCVFCRKIHNREENKSIETNPRQSSLYAIISKSVFQFADERREKNFYRPKLNDTKNFSFSFSQFVDNKPKRQPSFSGSSSHSKLTNGHGTLTKSNNNLLNQNTPKILKFQNDTDTSTLKRNSALNNMRLKQIDDDMEKY